MPRPLLALAVALALAAAEGAEELRVVRVSDGDTFTGLDAANRQIKIRLHGIDAPETRQAFGTAARKSLAHLIAGKTVSVAEVDRDRYGRVVARVRVDDLDVNREQVARGMAWRFERYDRQNEFGQAEARARGARAGLWADAAPIPPWECLTKKTKANPQSLPPN